MTERSDIREVAHWIRTSNYTAVLTGAGMSTESGIPDFRSAGGWWRQVDPRKVATVEALETDYPFFRDFYRARIEGLRACRPHRGHYLLAEWEAKGWVHAVATQNVDGFHLQAGSRTVYELHGSLHTFRCHDCGSPAEEPEFMEGRSCSRCGGRLRPNIVLFGELLPSDAWEGALAAIRWADLVLVIGTSLEVYPVSQLPSMAKGKLVFINLEPTAEDGMFDRVIRGKAGEVLAALDGELRAAEA
ncbi:MAG: NAD-dependent deacylase [Alicyclobacillaceae bacterium]|nr:NAD-dependent deacylase [Alicyclobacillaceae bacterium]